MIPLIIKQRNISRMWPHKLTATSFRMSARISQVVRVTFLCHSRATSIDFGPNWNTTIKALLVEQHFALSQSSLPLLMLPSCVRVKNIQK